MEKDFEELILKRCQKALMENKEYMEMEQSGECSPDELQAKAEVLCYKQCIKDMMAMRKL